MRKLAGKSKLADEGRRAFDRGAWSEAYSKLSAADRESNLEPEDLERYSKAAHLMGHDAEGMELLVRTQRGYQQNGDLQRSALCAFWLGYITLITGDQAQAGGWLARAQRLIEECGSDCVARGYLYLPQGYRAVHSGEPSAAYEAFVAAAEVGQRFEDLDLICMARQGQGRALIRQGETVRGVSLLDEVMISVMAGEVTPIVAGGIYCSVIESCSDTFDIGRAQEWTNALDRWCTAQPDMVPYRGNCLVHRAELLQLHGDWPGAFHEAQKAHEQFSRPRPRASIGSALYRIAELRRLRGEFDLAEAAYREAGPWGHAVKPGLALLRLAQGQVQVAHSMAVQLSGEATDTATRALVLDALVETAAAARDVSCAQQAAEELSRIANQIGAPLLVASATQAAGVACMAAGEFFAAQGHFRLALAKWHELDAPYGVAKVRVLLAQVCRELGDSKSADAELQDAVSVFRQLGAKPDLDRCEAILRGFRRFSSTLLSPRELEVLNLIAAGKTNRAISRKLNISEKTVARHVSNIFTKLDLSSRAAATAYAFRNNLVSIAETT